MYLRELLKQQSPKQAPAPAQSSHAAPVSRAPLVAPADHLRGVVDEDERQWLTYRQAAVRVHRDVRSIKRWRRDGLPGRLGTDGAVYIHVEDLTAWWRARMLADPTRHKSHAAAAN